MPVYIVCQRNSGLSIYLDRKGIVICAFDDGIIVSPGVLFPFVTPTTIMDTYKCTKIVNQRSVNRLQIPALNSLSTYLVHQTRESAFSGWLTSKALVLPLVNCSANDVLVPSRNGIIMYTPQEGDPNLRTDRTADTTTTQRDLTLFAGSPILNLVNQKDSILLLNVLAAAFQDFDDFILAERSLEDENTFLREYGRCEIFDLYRAARFALATTCMFFPQPGSFPQQYKVFIKYANVNATSVLYARYVDHSLLYGSVAHTLPEVLIGTPSILVSSGNVNGHLVPVKWASLGDGVSQVKDGMALRVSLFGRGEDTEFSTALQAAAAAINQSRPPPQPVDTQNEEIIHNGVRYPLASFEGVPKAEILNILASMPTDVRQRTVLQQMIQDIVEAGRRQIAA